MAFEKVCHMKAAEYPNVASSVQFTWCERSLAVCILLSTVRDLRDITPSYPQSFNCLLLLLLLAIF